KIKDDITIQEYEEYVHKIMRRQGEKEIKYVYVSGVIEDLQQTLKNLYPEIYFECDYAKNCVYERKLKDVPLGVVKNDMLDYDEYRRNTSKLCDHIKPKDIGKHVSYDLKIKIENKRFKHCQKCHSIYREPDILRYNRKQEWKKFNALTVKLCKHPQMVEISTHSDNRMVIKHCKQCHKTFSEIKKS
ncbi:MAG: hypothetical protein DA328_06290, partial [Nitrososphaeraceae archaeon]|nr:hypothetical protein [Nitrososphaeraceae archaeon]